MHIYIHIPMYVSIYKRMYVRIHVHTYTPNYICTYVSTYIHIHTYICTYTPRHLIKFCTYIHTNVLTYKCTCIRMCNTWIHTYGMYVNISTHVHTRYFHIHYYHFWDSALVQIPEDLGTWCCAILCIILKGDMWKHKKLFQKYRQSFKRVMLIHCNNSASNLNWPIQIIDIDCCKGVILFV